MARAGGGSAGTAKLRNKRQKIVRSRMTGGALRKAQSIAGTAPNNVRVGRGPDGHLASPPDAGVMERGVSAFLAVLAVSVASEARLEGGKGRQENRFARGRDVAIGYKGERFAPDMNASPPIFPDGGRFPAGTVRHDLRTSLVSLVFGAVVWPRGPSRIVQARAGVSAPGPRAVTSRRGLPSRPGGPASAGAGASARTAMSVYVVFGRNAEVRRGARWYLWAFPAPVQGVF